MSTNAQPITAGTTPTERSPEDTVRAFLLALQEFDHDTVMALSAPTIRWVNAPFTTSSNKQQFDKAVRGMFRMTTRFEVQYRAIHERGNGVVYTHRIDTIEGGGLSMKIDVHGEFRVEDGLVVDWVDRFSWFKTVVDVLKSLPSIVAHRLRR